MVSRTWLVRGLIALGLIAVLAWVLFPREYRAAVQAYQLTGDPHTIVVHASLGPGDVLIGGYAVETPSTVTVVVRARDTSSSNVGSGDSYFVSLTLRDPLGDRAVFDGTDLPGLAGHIVPRSP